MLIAVIPVSVMINTKPIQQLLQEIHLNLNDYCMIVLEPIGLDGMIHKNVTIPYKQRKIRVYCMSCKTQCLQID